MSKQTQLTGSISRRRFVAGTTAIIATAGGWSTLLRAEDLPHLAEDDPTAKALSYVHDATKVDSAMRTGENFCHNCQHYSGTKGAEWGPCALFPGKAVAANGWCNAWAARSGG